MLLGSWAAAGIADDSPAALKSGPQPGERVGSFYVRAVTGPLKNKSVCYVCRNGDRPVVMVFVRQVTPELKRLFKSIDELVDVHRAEGLRGFGVFAASDTKDLLPVLQTLAFDERLNLPLTISAATGDGPAGHGLHREAAVTVVLYHDQKVTANFTYRTGELTEKEIERVASAIRGLAGGSDVANGGGR